MDNLFCLLAILFLKPQTINRINKYKISFLLLYDILVLKNLLVLNYRIGITQVITCFTACDEITCKYTKSYPKVTYLRVTFSNY